MRATAWTAASVAILVLLSGCASGPSGVVSVPTQGGEFASPATFTETTGAIEGVVTDDQLVAISGAEIGLSKLGAFSTTDSLGRFSFSNLDPGILTVTATREGFRSGVQELEILAGRVSTISLVLTPLPTNESYVQFIQHVGKMKCDVSTGVAGRVGDLCVTDINSPDRVFNFTLGPGWNTTVFEGQTQPGSSFGPKGLFTGVSWRLNGRSHSFATWQGWSPLRGEVQVNQTSQNGKERIPDGPFTLGFVVAGWTGTQPGDVAVGIEQKWSAIVSIFYHGPAPVGYSALPDA